MKVDYAIIGFLLFVGRITLYGSSIGEAIALFALVVLCGFRHWLAQQTVKDKNAEFENAVKTEFEKVNVEFSNLRTSLGALNLGATYKVAPFRPSNGQQLKK
jgi:hypothetical protein